MRHRPYMPCIGKKPQAFAHACASSLLLCLLIAPLAQAPLVRGSTSPSAAPSHPPAHPFHVSKCMVEYNAKDKALQISLHAFTDDLEDGLRLIGADKLFLNTTRESPKAAQHLADYLARHLKLAVNGQPVQWQFIGHEPSEDLQATWCYLEVPDMPAPKSITITNDLLMEVFDDQKNIVSIFGPGGQQGMFLFERGRTQDTAKFQ